MYMIVTNETSIDKMTAEMIRESFYRDLTELAASIALDDVELIELTTSVYLDDVVDKA